MDHWLFKIIVYVGSLGALFNLGLHYARATRKASNQKLSGQLCVFGEDSHGLALLRLLDGLDQALKVLLVVVSLE